MWQTDIITDDKALDRLADAWNCLATSAVQKRVQLSHAWTRSWFEHMLQPDEQWRCVAVSENQDLVGILPLTCAERKVMGSGRLVLSPPLLGDFLIARGREDDVLPRLIAGLDDAAPGWDVLQLNRINDTSPVLSHPDARRKCCSVVTEPEGFRSFTELTGSYEDFASGFTTNHRRNLKKAHNKLERLEGVRIDFVRGRAANASQLGAYMRLEETGYKAREGGEALAYFPQRAAFKRSLLNRLSELGWLEWHILEAEGKPLAMQLAYVLGGVMELAKVSYDEAYSKLAPGKLLAEEMFKRLFDCGSIRGVNWGTDLPFHDLWHPVKQPYYAAWLFPNRAGAWLTGYLPRRLWLSVRGIPGLGRMAGGMRTQLKGGDNA